MTGLLSRWACDRDRCHRRAGRAVGRGDRRRIARAAIGGQGRPAGRVQPERGQGRRLEQRQVGATLSHYGAGPSVAWLQKGRGTSDVVFASRFLRVAWRRLVAISRFAVSEMRPLHIYLLLVCTDHVADLHRSHYCPGLCTGVGMVPAANAAAAMAPATPTGSRRFVHDGAHESLRAARIPRRAKRMNVVHPSEAPSLELSRELRDNIEPTRRGGPLNGLRESRLRAGPTWPSFWTSARVASSAGR
jgi:hypothetical protein